MTTPASSINTTQGALSTQPKAKPTYSIQTCSPVPAVVYVATPQELDDALEGFEGPYGFDCEWKCMPESSRVALVQLSNGSKVLLIQVSAMQDFPAKLRILLQDPSTPKIGVCVDGDGRRLREDYGVVAKNLVDLVPLALRLDAKFKKSHPNKRALLAEVVEHFLDQVLPKGPVRVSNWEHIPLRDKQREYAACDAHCAFEIYKLLIDRAAGLKIDLEASKEHVVDMMDPLMPVASAFPIPPIPPPPISRRNSWDRYPLAQFQQRPDLPRTEHHAWLMWRCGYSLDDILQTMERWLPPRQQPADEAAVISLVVGALAKRPKFPYDGIALRTLIETQPAALEQHRAFLDERCPVPQANDSDVQPPTTAPSLDKAVSGQKRKARDNLSPPNAESASQREQGTVQARDHTVASENPGRSSDHSVSSEELDGRDVKRMRVADS